MCNSMSLKIPKALPSLPPFHQSKNHSLLNVTSKYKLPIKPNNLNNNKRFTSIIKKPFNGFEVKKSSLAIQVGLLLATVDQPALAVTGVNNEEDIVWVLIQLAIVAFVYFLIVPPIIMNWLRTRWYKRNLLEMYFQFMFVFIFFPGLLLWAPFINFRKFPRDPNMKYPWSVPEEPSKIKSGYLKYPFAKPEDYEVL